MKKIIILISILFATSAQAANFTITIPDDKVPLVTNSFAALYNRPEQVPDPENQEEMIDNPETKAAFSKRILRNYVREVVRAANVKLIETERQRLITEADTASEGITVE